MRLEMLTNRADFQRVKAGVSFGTQGFLLQAIERDKQGLADLAPRFGITVSNHTVRRYLAEKNAELADNQQNTKKRPGKKRLINQRRGPVSVMRNRMRRRLREALRLGKLQFAKDGMDYVLIGRPKLLDLSFDFILKDLEKSFQKVHRRIISTHKQHS